MTTVQIHQGDCLAILPTLAAGSVQTCVTSPPYFGLRDYGHDDQIGLEETPDGYVAKLVSVFREVKRVLRDDGTLWLNLGDSYARQAGDDSTKESDSGMRTGRTGRSEQLFKSGNNRPPAGLKPKDLIGVPWLVAFALRADGWYLRSDIIWHKPNPMPESVTDRPTKAHEYIFLLSKSREYYYDADAIREEAHSAPSAFRNSARYTNQGIAPDNTSHKGEIHKGEFDSTSRNKRSVWTVTTKPYSGAHFATFPPDLIEPCILAGTSAYGCCAKCGAPWARVVELTASTPGRNNNSLNHPEQMRQDGDRCGGWVDMKSTTLGWQPTCTCNADIVPCTVLDPFTGSGTTGSVAINNGRAFVGCELNPDYVELAYKRIAKTQLPLLEAV